MPPFSETSSSSNGPEACPECHADAMMPGAMTHRFEIGDAEVSVTQIPADVCAECGFALYEQEVLTRATEIAMRAQFHGVSRGLFRYTERDA